MTSCKMIGCLGNSNLNYVLGKCGMGKPEEWNSEVHYGSYDNGGTLLTF